MGKILLLVALAVMHVSLPVHGSTISNQNGVIHCDGITCPAGSTSCIVSKTTFGDLTKYKYIRLCTNAYGIPTHTVEETLTNPYPGTVINSVSSFGGNGVISIGGNSRPLTEEEQRELDARMEKINQDTAKMIQDQNTYWDQWTKDFNANLEKQFPPGFPFNN